MLGSWPSIVAFGPSFIWKSAWDPVTSKFGALPMIYGTVVTSLIAIVLAAFVGIMAAVFLADFAPRWLAAPLSFMIELLAAVPSVVYGLWGLFVLAPVRAHDHRAGACKKFSAGRRSSRARSTAWGC